MKMLAYVLFVAFIVMAVFGLPLMGQMNHHHGCPFAPGMSSICEELLAHVSHWQSVFAVAVSQVTILFSIVLAVVFSRYVVEMDVTRYTPYRRRCGSPQRPLLLQELFSSGILHSKEPHRVHANYLKLILENICKTKSFSEVLRS